ncbi:MAG: hypothetical protein ACK5MN_08255 [Lachnospiraceae bacterium]
MKKHYIGRDSTIKHTGLIHVDTCTLLPDISQREFWGLYDSPKDALEAARAKHSNEDFRLCPLCCSTFPFQ